MAGSDLDVAQVNAGVEQPLCLQWSQRLIGRPGEEQSQVRLGVRPGDACEPTQVRRDGQPRYEFIVEHGREPTRGSRHVNTLSTQAALGKAMHSGSGREDVYRFLWTMRRMRSMRASMSAESFIPSLARRRNLYMTVSASGASRHFRHRFVNHIDFFAASLARPARPPRPRPGRRPWPGPGAHGAGRGSVIGACTENGSIEMVTCARRHWVLEGLRS